MPAYMLQHRHDARECGRCFAEADDPDAALALLPPYVAERANAVRVDRVEVP